MIYTRGYHSNYINILLLKDGVEVILIDLIALRFIMID